MEVFFNIFHQDTLRGFEMAKTIDVGIIVKIPLDSGWLTGKYTAQSRFDDIRSRWSREDIETRARLVNEVKSITGIEKNLAQQAIAFCLSYDAVSTVIPCNVNIEQLSNNVQSTNISIKPIIKEKLEKLYDSQISKLDLPW